MLKFVYNIFKIVNHRGLGHSESVHLLSAIEKANAIKMPD